MRVRSGVLPFCSPETTANGRSKQVTENVDQWLEIKERYDVANFDFGGIAIVWPAPSTRRLGELI
jgi:hypothetical protein